MFQKISQLFRRIETQHIKLTYDMDIDETGLHIVRMRKNQAEKYIDEVAIRKIMNYGYREEVERNGDQIIYVISEEDRQTLLSLKSLNPDIRPDGSLVFEIEPPVLKYLRKKNVAETDEAKKVNISDQPAQPTAKVNFNPGEGINIEIGYTLDGDEKVIPASEVKRTKDGKYTRLGNTFVPLREVSEKAAEFLNQHVINVPMHSIPEFFLRDLVILQKEFNAVLTDLAGKVQVVTDPLEPVVKVRKDPQGWLDFNVSYSAHGFQLPHDLIAKARKQGANFIQLDDLTWVKIDPKKIDNTEEKLIELDAIISENGFRVPVSEFASLDEFIGSIGGKVELDRAYREFLNQLTGFQADPKFELNNAFEDHLKLKNFTLRPYQRAGVHWLDWLRKNHLHGVLADDMGLGKTFQSLAALRLGYDEMEQQQHSLVIAPKSVLHHWEREIQRVFSYIRTYIYHGPSRSQRFFQSSLPYIFITTYETVVKDQEILARIPFYYLILDEATRIKNPDARRSQAIKALNAAHRLALSGTPVENRPSELWSLFDFLMRGHLGKHGTFVRVFEEAIINGETSATQRLGRRIKPFLLRRKKEQVAGDLPEKIILTEWVSLTEEQRRLYGGLQDEVKRLRSALSKGEQVNYATSILPVLSKLKQICDHPALVTRQADPVLGRSEKFDWMIEKVEDIIRNNEQVVIFSHFLNMLALFEAVFQKKNISYVRIDGSTDHRQVLIDSFNAGKINVALLSIMAAGYGINMTSANHVIHADRWWNPAVEDQATDRVHRIGQNKTVFVYHILTEGTLEEKIDTLLDKKRGMADRIVGAAAEGGHKWSREELLELLKPLD